MTTHTPITALQPPDLRAPGKVGSSALAAESTLSTTPRRFSEELHQLAQQFANRPASLADVVGATQGRGFGLLLFVIALPFVTPIPLPGLSTPFGIVILVIGARLALGREPWLPQRLLRRELPARFVARVLTKASVAVKGLEMVVRPRLDFLHAQWIYRRIAGVLIAVSGLLLLLPIPVPFTNTLPALTVILLSAGTIERDGLLFIAGAVMFALAIGYFALLAFGGLHAVEAMWS